ncbi:hypothetical protein IC234_07540 [Hymenobacter sp. BT189]|uniref:Late embryogenesis abundant protein LEA-2 subgroup domain-containing protein n=1 Tax=Hymenobacter armeniacus TaxID=2771358 RepID=A0ABR8JRN3_9BACT|nr:hypothetical protein [Hymenobacter armeniacus]
MPFPSVLLLGIVALLVWGACNNRHEVSACCGERVVRVDSLAASLPDAPPRLYLTIGLRNNDPDAARLESVRGALLFHGLYWSNFYRPRRRNLMVPPQKELFVPLVLRLTDSLACDPKLLPRLRQALRQGTAGNSTLRLELHVNLFLKDEEGYLEDSGEEISLPAMSTATRHPKR